ncbi:MULTISPECIES: DUF1214 domain-containing protein [unclassified Sphingobium]|nr:MULTISPECIES: DUF1214 domain-containing protein [unclassified Sphingobium]PSO12865.1 hypothetical protein C7E20_03675 [Sphingobium sp. AEW4]TWD05712.1 uncharacterized protein DUF1214 [Sphingobium sp. AEW010]MBG6120087.1 hypothetical protein [Sphingobium sp. JAI105]TWD23265.1 uncharacterized protein DUF1214 [Sphingobium sp. AEW013]TWD25125.1 uncharacterized protein DUF1214 [Sphingobium sp. AEW001]
MTQLLKSWDHYVDLLKPAAELVAKTFDPDSEQVRAELYRQFVMNIAQAYIWYFQSTPEHPDWMPFENSIFILQPNPDAVYHIAPVEGSGIYRITGKRGGNKVIGLATGRGMFGTHEPKGSLHNYDVDGLTLGEDGAFEVIFSGERPKNWTGDWCYLDPQAGNILIRQFAYDWGVEEEARFAIERLDRPAAKPRLSIAQIEEKLDAVLGGFVKRFSRICLDHQNKVLDAIGWNVMELTGFEDLGNSPQWPQKYYRCLYDIAPGEALVIETDLPETCKYWNVQLNDTLWQQIEFGYRQSSLNAHQARLDADGRFRMVVALEDPGVPNWLDTNGYRRGMLVGRWHGASDYPLPTIKKVKLDEVRQHLPADTPHVSAAEREAALRKRNIGLQMRRRW